MAASVLLAAAGCAAPGSAPAPTLTSPIASPAAPTATSRAVVVATDGTGDATTIAVGLALAADGDTVLVRPGTYREHVVLEKAIELRGAGGDQVVIAFDAASPAVRLRDGRSLPNGILVRHADARLSSLKVRGPAAGVAVQVEGGSPLLDNVSVELAGDRSTPDRYGLRSTDGASGIVRFGDFDGDVLVDDGATPMIESIGVEGRLLVRDAGTRPDVRSATLGALDIADGALASVVGSRIDGPVVVRETGAPDLGRNLLDGAGHGRTAVTIQGADPRIVGNRIAGFEVGIEVGPRGAPSIEGNQLTDNGTAILVRGRGVPGDTRPSISGNRFCGNGTDLVGPEGSDLTLDGNEVCQPEASEAG